MIVMDSKCNVFMLLHDQILADTEDSLPWSPELDNFVNNAAGGDVDSPFVNDRPGLNKTLVKELKSKIDKRNHSKSTQMLKEVGLIN